MVKNLMIIFSIAVLCLSLAFAQTTSDKKSEAIALVEKAVAFVNEHGREKGLAEMNKPGG